MTSRVTAKWISKPHSRCGYPCSKFKLDPQECVKSLGPGWAFEDVRNTGPRFQCNSGCKVLCMCLHKVSKPKVVATTPKNVPPKPKVATTTPKNEAIKRVPFILTAFSYLALAY